MDKINIASKKLEKKINEIVQHNKDAKQIIIPRLENTVIDFITYDIAKIIGMNFRIPIFIPKEDTDFSWITDDFGLVHRVPKKDLEIGVKDAVNLCLVPYHIKEDSVIERYKYIPVTTKKEKEEWEEIFSILYDVNAELLKTEQEKYMKNKARQEAKNEE